jgi:hypothetical protein
METWGRLLPKSQSTRAARRLLAAALSAASVLALVCTELWATTFINRPLRSVIDEAPIIVRGRTGESYADWGKSETRALYTYTDLQVTEVIKGDVKDSKIQLRQPGGVRDGIEMQVPGSAKFNREEDVVVLLNPKNADDGSYDVPGLLTGKYSVSQSADGQTILSNSLGGDSLLHAANPANNHDHEQMYNSVVTLDVFRKIASGASLPQAAEAQYSARQRDAQNALPKPMPTDISSSKPDSEVPTIAENEAAREKSFPWIPLLLVAAIGSVAALVFYPKKPGGV